jgi:aspartyl-tRNA(Asn)/glutamyl-tRNA(Gln) amidotransferase subunit C
MGGTADFFRPIPVGAVCPSAFSVAKFLLQNFYCKIKERRGSVMKITKETVSYVAELSRIKLGEEQTERMLGELSEIIDYMDILSGVDTEGVEPLSHVFSINNVVREDEVKPSYNRTILIENAPEHTEQSVVVPKTVE